MGVLGPDGIDFGPFSDALMEGTPFSQTVPPWNRPPQLAGIEAALEEIDSSIPEVETDLGAAAASWQQTLHIHQPEAEN